MNLSVKEQLLIQDLTAAENLSIQRYQKSSTEAKNEALKNLLSEISTIEQTHLDTLNAICANATAPTAGSGNGTKPKVPECVSYTNADDKTADAYLCTDNLSAEKQISGMYEVSIFEFAQPELRTILNHIQSEEQAHGQYLYEYMTKAGMAAC